MSVNKRDSTTGELVTLASGTRMWVGTKSAHDIAVANGTMPNNVMVCITDDAAGEEAWTYSTEETNTGKTWIDGKPIYRKVVDFGALPNTTSKTVAHGISNLSYITDLRGMCCQGGIFLSLPYIPKGSTSTYIYAVTLEIVDTDIRLSCEANMSNYSGYIILEYTKTTD